MTGFMRALPGDPCLNTEKNSKRVLLLKGNTLFSCQKAGFSRVSGEKPAAADAWHPIRRGYYVWRIFPKEAHTAKGQIGRKKREGEDDEK